MYWTIICRIGRGSFWSWFNVNRSTLNEDMRKNDFYISVSGDLGLWPQICSPSYSYPIRRRAPRFVRCHSRQILSVIVSVI